MSRVCRAICRTPVLLCCVLPIASAGGLDAAEPAQSRSLSFDERVACVERVEDVYWSHRIWPQNNPGVKPPRAEVVSKRQVEEAVETSLLRETALHEVWGESLGPERIQAELDRIARETLHPELLRDVFAALDDDPYLVAECFVRPRLAERALRHRYATDLEIHAETRRAAESILVAGPTAAELEAHGVAVTELAIRAVDSEAPEKTHLDGSDPELLVAPGELDDLIRWLEEEIGDIPTLVGAGFSPLIDEERRFLSISVLEADDRSLTVSVASWPKEEIATWLEGLGPDLVPADPPGARFRLPAIKSESFCVDNTWEPTSTVGAPASHSSNVTVWTGAEMIVWGGGDWPGINQGGRFDLAANSWAATSTSGAPSARQRAAGVWTGTEMVVWGGTLYPAFYNTGGRYNPATNSWTTTSTAGAPSARAYHTAVWTGTEMVVWGGIDDAAYLNTGGRYNPTSNTWAATSLTGAPSVRRFHTAIWSGSEMIVWGGNYGVTKYDDGGRYSPATDGWAPTSLTDVPEGRTNHTAVWTGTEMIVWGGDGGVSGWTDTGGRYAPATDGWGATTTAGAPDPRVVHTAVWTGTEMVVWGGGPNGVTVTDTGGRYDPSGDVWTATSTTDAPSPRGSHTAVWPGPTPRMIIWGGYEAAGATLTGGLYCVSGVVPYDFGDAPDPSYPTLSASDGARHRGGSLLFLGATLDYDDDGQPSADADGDDNDGNDDEDGVVFTSAAALGGSAAVDVTASEACLLNAWVDFSADGDWDDAGEQIFTDEPLVAGTNSLVFDVPADAATGVTFSRFRVDTTGGLLPTGAAGDGEVEDHQVTVVAFDYGDAPDPTYPTLAASGGAAHLLGGGLFLGGSVDAEPDGQPTAAADGDDGGGSDDEDGVFFTSPVVAGYPATLDVVASAAGVLNAWVDLNADGDWDDAGEQVFIDEPVTSGTNSLGFDVPSAAALGDTFARFRIDSAGGLAPTGLAADGEVEDVMLELRATFTDVPATGQTIGYAGGDDGTYQAGIAWPEPRFVDHGDGTITDTLTGLMWTQDNVTPGPPPCTPGVRKTWYDALTHIDCLNAEAFLGHTDWRLPNVIEIHSLAHLGEPNQNDWLASRGFTLSPYAYWWSSTTPASGLATAFVLSWDGGTYGAVSKTNATGPTVWPVRGSTADGAAPLRKTGQVRCWNSSYSEIPCAGTGQDGEHQAGMAWPSPRFEIDGDCVTDRMTGLMWTKDGNLFGSGTWADAIDYANGLVLCGHDDWRLPSKLESDTLIHFDRRIGPVPPTMMEWWHSQGFVNTSQYASWTGTTDPSDASSAYKMQGRSNKDSTTYVTWPVRGNLPSGAVDLAISMTDSVDPVSPTAAITYTVEVTNLGPGTASQVTVTDTLPAGSTFVAATGSGWSCGEDGGVVTCTTADLTPGPAAEIAIEIDSPATSGEITNLAVVDAPVGDPVGDNNAAAETTLVADLDFGDAPDPGFPTLLASDGARHVIGGPLYFGSLVDGEDDGLPSTGATGDDIDNLDDEDGVSIGMLPIGGPAFGTIEASAAGLVNGWIDFNGDGDWSDPGEQVFTDYSVTAGSNAFSIPVPPTAVAGQVIARFRIDSGGGLSPTGLAQDGEVEDHAVVVVALDFGDAPDPGYPTLRASSGAYHIVANDLWLGASVDADLDGQPTAAADGDDADGSDDEDGVVFATGLGRGLDAAVVVTASNPGLLDAWVDFNGDGDWADAGEHIFDGEPVAAGANPLGFPVPVDATLGTSFARFRLASSDVASYGGGADDGEVEDYMVEIVEGPDLEIAMTGAPAMAPSGRPLVYTVTVTNHGPLDATSVTVSQILPDRVSLVSSTPGAPDCTLAGDTLTCDLGTLPPGGTVQVIADTVLDHPVWGGFSSSATVAAAELDPITGNNTVVVDTLIGVFGDGFESGDVSAWD